MQQFHYWNSRIHNILVIYYYTIHLLTKQYITMYLMMILEPNICTVGEGIITVLNRNVCVWTICTGILRNAVGFCSNLLGKQRFKVQQRCRDDLKILKKNLASTQGLRNLAHAFMRYRNRGLLMLTYKKKLWPVKVCHCKVMESDV